MGSKGDLYLGLSGSEILLSPYGRTFLVRPFEIARDDRTASGRLVSDVIATKHEFTLSYELIDGDDLQDILDLYDLYSELSFQVWPSGDAGLTTTPSGSTDSYDQYTVRMRPVERERLIMVSDGMWAGVTVTLEEV